MTAAAAAKLDRMGDRCRPSCCPSCVREWFEDCALDSADPGIRFFWSLFGFLPSLSLPGDCLKMSSRARPEVVEGVPESERSVFRSLLPPGGDKRGVVSFLGVT